MALHARVCSGRSAMPGKAAVHRIFQSTSKLSSDAASRLAYAVVAVGGARQGCEAERGHTRACLSWKKEPSLHFRSQSTEILPKVKKKSKDGRARQSSSGVRRCGNAEASSGRLCSNNPCIHHHLLACVAWLSFCSAHGNTIWRQAEHGIRGCVQKCAPPYRGQNSVGGRKILLARWTCSYWYTCCGTAQVDRDCDSLRKPAPDPGRTQCN